MIRRGVDGYGCGVNAGVARPLVFVDVDGVLIPFRPRPSISGRRGVGDAHGGDGPGNPLLERLDPDDGRRLLDLPGDLVWASTWMADTNDLAPRGLAWSSNGTRLYAVVTAANGASPVLHVLLVVP
jgi:hypothetical protein